MGAIVPEGVTLTRLEKIPHPKGDIYQAMKATDDGFAGFGEAYFTTILHNEIKGWKKHKNMTLNLVVPEGSVKFVIYDDRKNSVSRGTFFKIVLSKSNYQRLTVPPNVWMAFHGLGGGLNLLLNLANLEHQPDEAINLELDEFDYVWDD